jgi:hypothetical protein
MDNILAKQRLLNSATAPRIAEEVQKMIGNTHRVNNSTSRCIAAFVPPGLREKTKVMAFATDDIRYFWAIRGFECLFATYRFQLTGTQRMLAGPQKKNLRCTHSEARKPLK